MDATAEVGEYGNSIGDFGGSLDAASSLDAYDTVEMSKSELKEVKAGHESEEDQDFDEDDDSPTERLQYLAKMMQAKTAGEVPFHGVVIAVPFDKFLARENFKTIAAAIKRDLVELREAGEIMFPVSIVFTSMEKDQGFPKLQNLLGSQRATAGRFGAGCRVEDVPVLEKTNLKIQVQKACQSFEDWVINRWAKPSQLARAAQNKELFKLVVRIRQQFKPKLEYLLEEALEWNPSESPDGEGTDLLLAGCYFVSTGQHANDRGFLNGVFLKCQEFAETSSWADSILGRDRVYSVISTLLFLCSILILIGLGIYLYWS
jgi:type VI protein secretion system component VasK